MHFNETVAAARWPEAKILQGWQYGKPQVVNRGSSVDTNTRKCATETLLVSDLLVLISGCLDYLRCDH